jgi:hypothetical protein
VKDEEPDDHLSPRTLPKASDDSHHGLQPGEKEQYEAHIHSLVDQINMLNTKLKGEDGSPFKMRSTLNSGYGGISNS